MADLPHAPLNWQASATTTNPQISTSLPSEVVSCLKHARFVSGIMNTENYRLVDVPAASPSNMLRSVPPRLPHELHLPAFHAFLPSPHHNNDHQPILEEDDQPRQESTRLAPCTRLGLPQTPNPGT